MEQVVHKELTECVDLQFAPHYPALRERHDVELRKAQFLGRQTNNGATVLPAEARCYVDHISQLTIVRAHTMAAVYTAFGLPAGEEAVRALTVFYGATLAARRASFQGEIQLRSVRTGNHYSQLRPLLNGFEREAQASLLEGLAILSRQRMALVNGKNPVKYIVDTCIFNWLADGDLDSKRLPNDGGFAITHVQLDEINLTDDTERRAQLLLVQASLRCELLPTNSFVFDVSRVGHAKFSNGKLINLLRDELNALNKNKPNNVRDALIAEAAIASGFTLLTADADLKSAAGKFGGKVLFYSRRKPS